VFFGAELTSSFPVGYGRLLGLERSLGGFWCAWVRGPWTVHRCRCVRWCGVFGNAFGADLGKGFTASNEVFAVTCWLKSLMEGYEISRLESVGRHLRGLVAPFTFLMW